MSSSNTQCAYEAKRSIKSCPTAVCQGDRFEVKLINLDDHTHYFRNVDFGPRLHEDVADCCGAGGHSFEVMNFKGTYGVPKVAEMQWRTGWGFRPHFNIIQQQDVFPRPEDQVLVKPFTGGFGETWSGYQWSGLARGGEFRFSPPPFIITSVGAGFLPVRRPVPRQRDLLAASDIR
jgi:hypothetical protein